MPSTSAANEAHAPNTTAFDPIPRVLAPSVERFEREFQRPHRPVVITGVLDGWPARRLWSVEHFRRNWSDLDVISIPLRGGVVDVAEGRAVVFERIRLGAQVEAMAAASDVKHCISVPLAEMPQRFRDEIHTPVYCAGAMWLRPRFWLARAGTVTPVHRDIPENFSAQIFGTKRWLLYPPSQSAWVYPCPPWSRAPNFARVDPDAPDFERFPKFAKARPMGCVLQPGEMLFIPRFWWHHVRSIEDNGAVNFWFGGPATAAAGVASTAFKRMRSLYRGEWG